MYVRVRICVGARCLKLAHVLHRLESALKDHFQLREMEVPLSEERLRWSLSRFLEAAAKKHDPARIVIVIDGVNRLRAEGAADGTLHWLPTDLPTTVRFIVSTVEYDRQPGKSTTDQEPIHHHRTFTELKVDVDATCSDVSSFAIVIARVLSSTEACMSNFAHGTPQRMRSASSTDWIFRELRCGHRAERTSTKQNHVITVIVTAYLLAYASARASFGAGDWGRLPGCPARVASAVSDGIRTCIDAFRYVQSTCQLGGGR